jgi:hypothetical protein
LKSPSNGKARGYDQDFTVRSIISDHRVFINPFDALSTIHACRLMDWIVLNNLAFLPFKGISVRGGPAGFAYDGD